MSLLSCPGVPAVTDTALILFDLNGVLYRYDRQARINSLAAIAHQAPDAIDAAIWGSGFEDSGDAGAVDADAYLRGFGALIGTDLSETDWLATLGAAVTTIQAALDLLPRIRPGLACAVLTNNNLLVRRHFRTLYPEVAALVGNRAFVSAEFSARKPDPDAYRLCLARLGIEPAAALFIDDSQSNVAGARAAGLAGHHATGPEDLAAALTVRGLLR
jgi:putative hydrolase of the HAD superfamily